MDIRKLFGRNLKRARIATGWSQEQLAFETGLHRTYISGIERGERNPSIKNVEKIALALSLTPSALFQGWKPR